MKLSKRIGLALLSSAALASLFGAMLACSGRATPQPATQPAVKVKPGKLTVEVVEVRLEPFHTATGFDTYQILVDWKNTGGRPVRGVAADMKAFDADGNELFSSPDYYVYASSNDGPGIVPGQTHRVKSGEGHTIIPTPSKTPVRATAHITKVEETSHY